MSPSATLPTESALQETLSSSKIAPIHAPHLHHLALTIQHNLEYQHSWTHLTLHTHSPLTHALLPRPMLSGLPPKRAYIHPDEQIATLKAEHALSLSASSSTPTTTDISSSATEEKKEKIEQAPEREWVLPSQIQENWSLAKFAEVFDAVGVMPPIDKEGEGGEEDEDMSVGYEWRGERRQKRLLLATLHDDSTVVYYIMHDGIVKPRQN